METVGLEGEQLGDVGTFDAIVSTFTLCTIPGIEKALENLRRHLKPDGRFYFLEHGLAPDDGTVKWQRRLEPAQSFLFGGCRLTRQHEELVGTYFEIESMDRFYGKGPKPLSYFYQGVAQPR